VKGVTGAWLVVPVAVEAAPPHRITGLNFAPTPAPSGITLRAVADPAGTVVAGEARLDGLFDIGGGRQLYLSCVGAGSPTVVLESGLNDPAAPWFGIESAVAPFTRVCSYDRANSAGSASDPTPAPRSGEDTVADLHALLTAADVPGPYVLVGHSIGGLIARLFASNYPDEVSGLVLVDSSHEDQDVRLEALVTAEQWAAYQQFFAQFPSPEGIDMEATFDQVRAARAAAPMRPMPLIVLTAGQTAEPSLFPPGWPVEADAELWRELQTDLAGLVPNARHIVAEQSGHYIHQAEPDLVVEAIRQVVAAVRDPSVWVPPTATTPAP
jgi:pimeloyl-ACP methyl ester carboxylesterase